MKETRDLRMVDLSIESAIAVDLIPAKWIVEKEETNIGRASIEEGPAPIQIVLEAMIVASDQRIMNTGEVKVQGVTETDIGIVIEIVTEIVTETVTEIGKETEIGIEIGIVERVETVAIGTVVEVEAVEACVRSMLCL